MSAHRPLPSGTVAWRVVTFTRCPTAVWVPGFGDQRIPGQRHDLNRRTLQPILAITSVSYMGVIFPRERSISSVLSPLNRARTSREESPAQR